ncbi:MAG: phospholipid carrier-dependent glycosyltransferase [Anaerolineae bacterium]|nr:phospholipid carrier-dependent glycosyltransferase [Anaerolineae bacterium]
MKFSDLKSPRVWIPAILIVLLLAGYLFNLTGSRLNDDEGEYLYQAWRMATAGELPYRDFMTPQLPVFLFAGASIMKLGSASLWVMRFYSVVLTFASAVLLFFAGRRHHGFLAGLLALLLFLFHPDVFKDLRIFRNEPLFMFFVTLGVVLATWPKTEPQRRFLVASGVSFGLGTMAKLFGLLPAGGIGLWLLWDAWRVKRPFSQLLRQVIAFVTPLLLVLLLLAGGFYWFSPHFFEQVLGHHLMQGSGETLQAVLARQLGIFAYYLRLYPVLLIIALVSAALGFKQGDGRSRWAWQLPSVLILLFLSRELLQRHFMYALPAIVLLAAWLLADLVNGRYRGWGRVVGIAAILLILIPSLQKNIQEISFTETGTEELVSLIQAHTEADDTIMVDDIGLAFYARRPTTYSGAAISHGAITSGQITGEMLIDEIIETDTRLVTVEVSVQTGWHLIFLRDYPRFHRFLENKFSYLGQFNREYQLVDVWVRDGEKPIDRTDNYIIDYPDNAQFGESITLIGYSIPDTELAPGDPLDFTLYWTSSAPTVRNLTMFTHLIHDESGALVGQQDKRPYNEVYPTYRWWPGEVVDEKFTIIIPEDAPEGQYHLSVGLYDWQTGERLNVPGANGEQAAAGVHQLDIPIMISRSTGSD